MACGTGCGDCSTSSGGCETAKTPQRAFLTETLARLYPSLTWGEPDDEVACGGGVSEREGRRLLAQAMAAVAKAPVFYRSAAAEDLCATIYVLCLGREPALIDVRDGLTPPDLAAGPVRERYLRVALSTVARAAAIQEVALELDPDADSEAGAWLRELPLPGVYDAKLLKRMRALVDLLNASGVQHLDFGLCDQPLDGGRPGDYDQCFGGSPMVSNFLFFSAPTRMTQETWIPLVVTISSFAAEYAG